MIELTGRVVVVSPHLDDAVMSLGATIARSVRKGADVEVLTVFAGSPDSSRPAGEWDTRTGFLTEGEAARERRREDRRACDVLGSTPVWLSHSDSQYRAAMDESAFRADIHAALVGRDIVLLPGWPARHGDHVLLARTLLAGGLPCEQVALYVEQPYAWRFTRPPPARSLDPPDAIRDLVPAAAFATVSTTQADRVAKWEAIGEYRTQLPHLGPPQLRREVADYPEAVAWIGEGMEAN